MYKKKKKLQKKETLMWSREYRIKKIYIKIIHNR